jgi:hypothetical protein
MLSKSVNTKMKIKDLRQEWKEVFVFVEDINKILCFSNRSTIKGVLHKQHL